MYCLHKTVYFSYFASVFSKLIFSSKICCSVPDNISFYWISPDSYNLQINLCFQFALILFFSSKIIIFKCDFINHFDVCFIQGTMLWSNCAPLLSVHRYVLRQKQSLILLYHLSTCSVITSTELLKIAKYLNVYQMLFKKNSACILVNKLISCPCTHKAELTESGKYLYFKYFFIDICKLIC